MPSNALDPYSNTFVITPKLEGKALELQPMSLVKCTTVPEPLQGVHTTLLSETANTEIASSTTTVPQLPLHDIGLYVGKGKLRKQLKDAV